MSIDSGKLVQKSPQKSLIQLRSLAAKTLAQVYNSNQSLEQSLFEEITRGSERTYADFDRAWVYEICSGVLRYRGRLDHIIDTYSLKKKPSGALRRYLQIAVYQLLVQDVAPALVVSESVAAIREHDGEIPAKFSNAVLRKISDSVTEWKSWQVTEKSPFEEQVAWCSLPEWLFKKLRKDHGTEWTFAFAKTGLERPKTWYRELAKTAGYTLENGYQGNEPEGYVQDISNQLLVEEVLKEIQVRFKSRQPKILDLCSAPGGKTLGLAAAGFQVTATDQDETRLQKVIENRSRLKMQDRIKIVPFSQIWVSDAQTWDVIWIDAPCSSTGIIRRHPEIKWNRTWHDVERLILLQEELIKWGSTHLSKNGMLIYSTCSMLKAENEFAPNITEGLSVVKKIEYSPQNEPLGDGIIATLFEKP